MEKITSYYRQGTPDCPVDISYFAPSVIREAAITEGSSKMTVTLVLGGQVELGIGGKNLMLAPGDIVTILPYELFTFRSVAMDTRYVLAEFSLDLISMLPGHFFQKEFVEPIRAGRLQVPRLITGAHPLHPTLLALLSRLDVKKEWLPGYKAEVFSIVLSFCTGILPYCTPVEPAAAPAKAGEDPVYLCIDYIRHHYAEQITLQALADYVHLHPNYLCALFKKRTGKTVFAYLIRYRITWSSKLLRSTALPVNQVARACGFPSTSFFTRKFTALHDCSPAAYRKKFSDTGTHHE